MMNETEWHRVETEWTNVSVKGISLVVNPHSQSDRVVFWLSCVRVPNINI